MNRFMRLCIGMGVGLATGVLWAPRRGKDTRTLIQKETRLRVRYLRRQTHQLQRDLSRLKQRGARLMSGQGEAVRAAVAAGKRADQRASA
jgi:gas vesicle protein